VISKNLGSQIPGVLIEMVKRTFSDASKTQSDPELLPFPTPNPLSRVLIAPLESSRVDTLDVLLRPGKPSYDIVCMINKDEWA